ncbi:MAG: endonuclease MutS2, partial [Bacteroidota bacterium]
MKVYPKDIESKLGFDQIKKLLADFCQSQNGTALALKVKPINKYEIVTKWLDQVKEMMRLKSDANGQVSFEFSDFEEYLIKLKVPGTFLDPADFHKLKRGVLTVDSWIQFFKKYNASYPQLLGLVEKIDLDPTLSTEIDDTIDRRGEVKDHVSLELSEIRRNISKSERAVRSAIQRILKKAKSDEFASEDSALTIRDGRLVIPVKAEHKKRIPGFVHDESATGQTVYLEPGEVLNLNNEVRELKYRERREVIRILISLSDKVRRNLPELMKGVDLIEKLDLIYAKTKLLDLLNASIPDLKKQTDFELINANHPLLYLSHKASGKSVIPLSLTLNHENRILIISGPNAGGKSVALKTVGLIQSMIQAGLPIPVHEESKLGFFFSMYIDIGDTQSIEDDLSTYSSHLTSIKFFLQHSDNKSLFLIDEFGKGTEPQFGGAIAESVLCELNTKKSFGIVTTHYQNLKKIGDETPGLINGAMKYDHEALEPLFELEVGKPGSSFAFEIAGKIGLPQEILNKAKKQIGKSQVDYDKLLNQLEKEKDKYNTLIKKLEKDQIQLLNAKKDYKELKQMLEEDRKRIIKEAKYDARKILDDANKEVERVIREIKESKAAKEQTAKARRLLQIKRDSNKEHEVAKKEQFKSGDVVSVIGQDTSGTIQKING